MSTKKLHREILLSSVYKLSSENSQVNYAKDSANRLYCGESPRMDRNRFAIYC